MLLYRYCQMLIFMTGRSYKSELSPDPAIRRERSLKRIVQIIREKGYLGRGKEKWNSILQLKKKLHHSATRYPTHSLPGSTNRFLPSLQMITVHSDIPQFWRMEDLIYQKRVKNKILYLANSSWMTWRWNYWVETYAIVFYWEENNQSTICQTF